MGTCELIELNNTMTYAAASEEAHLCHNLSANAVRKQTWKYYYNRVEM